MPSKLRVGIIGCGVIGGRRAAALPEFAEVSGLFDPDAKRIQALQKQIGREVPEFKDVGALFNNVDAVIIAGINSVLVGHVAAAVERNIPVLVEKPCARSFAELNKLKLKPNSIVKAGFNHRFHPAFIDLQAAIKSDPNDEIMFIRAQYGNGARLGFEKEWRGSAELSGGGELLDQGVHLIDLARCLLPDLNVMQGFVRTHFWDMKVDDNAWAICSTPEKQTFTFHVSSSEWKNEFRFEVYTRKTKYQWLGLGRSYGPEKLLIHRMTPEMGPPQSEERVYPAEDHSWLLENTNFLEAVRSQGQLNGSILDAKEALRMVQKIYETSKMLQGPEGHPIWWQEA